MLSLSKRESASPSSTTKLTAYCKAGGTSRKSSIVVWVSLCSTDLDFVGIGTFPFSPFSEAIFASSSSKIFLWIRSRCRFSVEFFVYNKNQRNCNFFTATLIANQSITYDDWIDLAMVAFRLSIVLRCKVVIDRSWFLHVDFFTTDTEHPIMRFGQRS